MGTHENPKNARSLHRIRNRNWRYPLLQKTGQRSLCFQLKSLPFFYTAHWWKVYQEASPSGLPAEMNVKDLLPISVFTLLRLYLVQTRDLELLRRKEKKEKVAVVLKHVLSESKAMLCLWGYTLSKGVQDLTWVFTDKYGILWREYNTLQSYWLAIWTHQLWGRTLYHKCRW